MHGVKGRKGERERETEREREKYTRNKGYRGDSETAGGGKQGRGSTILRAGGFNGGKTGARESFPRVKRASRGRHLCQLPGVLLA